jgi:predicted peptidase
MPSPAVAASCLILLSLLVNGGFTQETASRQQANRIRVQVPVDMNYLLYLPDGYEERESWPLLVFLHGSGERGSDLELVKKHGPPKLIDAGRKFPFIVVSPQCPTGRTWESLPLVALLNELEQQYKVDPDRVYVTGLSMGGTGTWRLASVAAERLAAIAPICGRGETFLAGNLAKLPIWVFHGDQDSSVPLENSAEMVEAVREMGGTVEFTVYPGVGHDSWTRTYENPEFYEWLLAQKRAPSNP